MNSTASTWAVVSALAATLLGLHAVGHAQDANPPSEGFNLEASDARAIEVADAVMSAMGGREAWDRVRFVAWNFFGRRSHVWDKFTGDLRFENGDTLVLMNLHSKEGKAWEAGSPIEGDALREVLDRTHGAWINDSYWVFMPYKLKDSGVTLTYQGAGESVEGSECHVLQLTFEDVGRTPDNRYLVYVDKASNLVVQWDYFKAASDTEPGFQIPWRDWQRHGPILLSADRGERKHEFVAVLDEVPRSVFESPDPVDPQTFRMR